MANEAVKRFFSAPNFAVAGASQDTNKFGYKILAWYHRHSLLATPLNPRASSITLSNFPSSPTLPTLASPSALPSPTETSLSVVTPPHVTLPLLKEAKKAGIKAVWLQPGTFDDAVLKYIHGEAEGEDKGGFETHLAGFETEAGQPGPGGGEGWCVLVDGEGGMRAAGRKEGKI
ncbi:MAG: hypothetical protein MMC23_006212 [Stictis urceolatum]|nr:hypothetical protein [Stictis urceolata]